MYKNLSHINKMILTHQIVEFFEYLHKESVDLFKFFARSCYPKKG